MKKSIIAAVLTGVVLLSGCSKEIETSYQSQPQSGNSSFKSNGVTTPIMDEKNIASIANDLVNSRTDTKNRITDKNIELGCSYDWYIYDKDYAVYFNEFNNLSDKEIAKSIYILSGWHKLGVETYKPKGIEWVADYIVFKKNDGTVIAGEEFVNEENGNYSQEIEWYDENVKNEYENGVADKSLETSFDEYLKKHPRDDDISLIDNKAQREKFNKKCDKIIEQMEKSLSSTTDFNMQFAVSSLQYDNSDKYSSKLYTIKGDNEDDRYLLAFLDIYTTDEYEFFQATKEFISFVSQNALDICGRNQFVMEINSQENGLCDIGITYDTENSSITYTDRSTRSAYSERLKSIDILSDCNEQLTVSGLLNYDEVSKTFKAYDVSCEFQGKVLTHKWYNIEDGKNKNIFVTYIDDGTYDNLSDEELIYYAYNSAFTSNNVGATNYINDGHYFAYKSSKDVACSIRYYEYGGKMRGFYCTWGGEYEYLNSNPLNQELLDALNEETE